MDSYREFPSDFELGASAEAAAPSDVTSAIGTDERRMHVRAYNYWTSLLDGRDFPSIEDLEPADISDFAAHSVLLDFTCGRDNPAVPYIGASIREECGLEVETNTIADVPSRSLLSRLTDHYMQIIANRAPIGFEAEFANQRGETICYRGILMPFSSDGDTIDFIYGVINWKHVEDAATATSPIESAVDEGFTAQSAEELLLQTPAGIEPLPAVSIEADAVDEDDDELGAIELDQDAGLADRLWAARETAEVAKAGEGRTRTALYRALSLAYDFATAARDNPADYAELLEESGLKAQERAPMTPIVKLVFGIDYDKARLTEFAAALSYGLRQEVARGGFQQLIEMQAGGLKALVAAERQARRPAANDESKSDAARARLRSARPITLAQLPPDEEFALVVTRRGADGEHEIVAVVEDQALIERAIRRAA
jgi:hypothetical protein